MKNTMTRLVAKLLGAVGPSLSRGRAAELRGDLAQAAALFAQEGLLDEAARVMLLRGDAEADPSARLRHYVQAAATAPASTVVRDCALRKRAMLALAMAAEGPMTVALLQDVAEAARDLEALGDHGNAAQAYAMVGDIDGRARALTRSGDVDRLDALLSEQHGRERRIREVHDAREEVAALVATGRRRDAVALARAVDDGVVRERGRAVEAKRIAGSVVRVVLHGRTIAIVLGEEIVIGRAPSEAGEERRTGSLTVPSVTLSRRHLALARTNGQIVVRDLGSRNGTTLRGLALAREATVGTGIDLLLGPDVALALRATDELPDAIAIEVAGGRYVATLGPAALGVGQWRLERGTDDWVELVTDDQPPAFAGNLQLSARVTLVAGDAIASERGGRPRLVVEGGA
jgi:FHA domain